MNPIDEIDDDKPVGRVLSRREVLIMLGGAGAAVIAATGFKQISFGQTTPEITPEATESLPACIVRPAETEGPYFVDEMLNRSDIRLDPMDNSVRDGTLLKLKFRVSQMSDNTCTPLEGAQVDVWHCDAAGAYSDVNDAGGSTLGHKWLRGYQVTDENGVAEFITIYPGWYSGRTVHIHFKIRTDPASDAGYEFTSQLFFDDELTDEVFKAGPYASKGIRNTRNDNDGIYGDDGEQLLLDLVEEDEGYSAVFDIALDLSQPAAVDQFGGGNGGGPGGAPPGGGQPPQPRATSTPSS